MTISGLLYAFDSNSAMNDLTTRVGFFVGTVDWNTVESCPTYFGVEDVELKELADALKILHVYCDTKDWNEDDFISVFEELTGAHYTLVFSFQSCSSQRCRRTKPSGIHRGLVCLQRRLSCSFNV